MPLQDWNHILDTYIVPWLQIHLEKDGEQFVPHLFASLKRLSIFTPAKGFSKSDAPSTSYAHWSEHPLSRTILIRMSVDNAHLLLPWYLDDVYKTCLENQSPQEWHAPAIRVLMEFTATQSYVSQTDDSGDSESSPVWPIIWSIAEKDLNGLERCLNWLQIITSAGYDILSSKPSRKLTLTR